VMARAYRCDRCPNLYEEAKSLEIKGEIYEINSGGYRVQYHLSVQPYGHPERKPELCPACRVDILNAIVAELRPQPAAESEREGE